MNNRLFFYQSNVLVTIKHGAQSRTILRSADVPLAEQQTDNTRNTGLLATDDKRSVLQVSGDQGKQSHAYTAYGYDPTLPSAMTVLAFNGEPIHSGITGAFLGNGYRCYPSALMRFNSPDSWSPFAAGGLNPYCYSLGDPVNRVDPTGHVSFPMLVKAIIRFRGLRQRPLPNTATNGLLSMITTPVPRKPAQVAYVAPVSRSATVSHSRAQSAPASVPQRVVSPRAITAPNRPEWPAGATNGVFETITFIQPASSRPQARVLPTQASPVAPSTGPQARRYSSDTSLSAGSSRDSTPASSRSSSPSPGQSLPDFVQRASDLRQSTYYSPKFN
ncbi:RHS repeat-associated core domain-containing protein [Pseudomonas putida]|uniref:RHS repeat-associated core domain-containing protein n=1 Tax=Pseudomonas putida TaxID=303 RepID=UPI003C6DFCFA